MNRINIIGAPGSGKTTLARKLSKIYNLPVIHMDGLGVGGKYDAMENKELFNKKIEKESAKNKWIMEGVYKSTLDSRIPRADITILLDYPRRVYIFRVFKRRIEYHNKTREEMAEGWKEHINWGFLKYVLKFNKDQLPAIKEYLNKYPDSVVVSIRNNKQLDSFLEGTS